MNVITHKNLTVPKPPVEWRDKLRANAAAFAGPNDHLVNYLAEDWPGPQAVHCLYSFGLNDIVESPNLDDRGLFCWRFIGGGHKDMTTAAGCWAADGLQKGAGEPQVMAALQAPELAELLLDTASLNNLMELKNRCYELRVLRVPALCLEAFWLKSEKSPEKDVIVPCGLLVDGEFIKLNAGAKGKLKKNQAYPIADFLNTIRGAARHKLAVMHKPSRATAKAVSVSAKPY